MRSVLIPTLILLAPVAALAQTPDAAQAPGTWDALLQQVIPVLGAVIMALASWALKALRDKYKLDLDITADAFLRAQLRSVIRGVEERAASAAKLGGVKPAGASKMAWALEAAKKLSPKMADSELTRLLTEELARVPNAGSTGGETHE